MAAGQAGHEPVPGVVGNGGGGGAELAGVDTPAKVAAALADCVNGGGKMIQ